MNFSVDTNVLTGNQIEPRFAEIEFLASLTDIKNVDIDTLRKKVLPKYGKHFVFLGDEGFAVAYESQERYMVLNKPPVDPRLHVWFASTPKILIDVDKYFVENTTQKRTTILVWPRQTELKMFAVRHLNYCEEVRAGEIYSTPMKSKF